MLRFDPRNPVARELGGALEAALAGRPVPGGAMVVVGGDGFLLATVREFGLDRLYVGVNAGRIGFLLNDVADVSAAAERIAAGAWTEEAFSTLHARVSLADGGTEEVVAINDVALERSTGQTAHLSLHLDGALVVERLVADGVVVSTALGSTAYTVSAGGPACHPTLGLLAITAISPHHPRLAPVLLPAHADVVVRALDVHRRPVRVVADGRTLDGVEAMTVRTGASCVRLGWLGAPDFTARMVRKILHP